MSTRPKAIAFFRMYKRLHAVLPPLLNETDYHLVLDFEVDLPPSERIHNIQSLLRDPSLEETVRHEMRTREVELASYVSRGLSQLPHSSSFSGAALERFCKNGNVGLERVFKYFALFEKIIEQFDLQAVVCSPSYLIRHQAIIAAARHFQIPSIHCPHGCFPEPDYLLPEVADYVLLGDRLGVEELQRTRVGPSKGVITGSPFTIASCTEQEIMDPERKRTARETLGIKADECALLYGMVGFDALNALFPYSYHTLVESLQCTIKAIQERMQSGKKYKLFVRQHPTMAVSENEVAIRSIAEEMGFSDNFILLNSQKEVLLDAADALVLPVPKSSLIFDAFARALPVVALAITPRFPHPFVDTTLNQYIDTPLDFRELVACLTRLDESSGISEKAISSFRFQRDNRIYTGESATANMISFITAVAGGNPDSTQFQMV